MQENKKRIFLNRLDQISIDSQEMIYGKGEDNFCCAYRNDSAFIAVCDGCGGIGSQIYESMGGHTGAFLSSRLISGAVYDWYDAYSSCNRRDELYDSLKSYLNQALSVGSKYAVSTLKLRGSMVRSLPTTLVLVKASLEQDHIALDIFWVGDSRIYLLNRSGLMQLTRDDLAKADAFSNLFKDEPLTNVISAEGQYQLHYKHLTLTGAGMIIAATDGCYNYVTSPMEFEHLILKSLDGAENFIQFRSSLKKTIMKCAGDDYSIGIMAFDYGSFDLMKNELMQRKKDLEKDYFPILFGENQFSDIEPYWKVYKKVYELYMDDEAE